MGYSLCLDIGTTNIRCAICDPKQSNKIVTIVYDKVHTFHLNGGRVEINPQQLWTQITDLMKKCIVSSTISVDDISGLGISAQRNTFVTWNKSNGEEFHNFILWNDLRANQLVNEYNKSWTIWGLNSGCKLLFYVTREKRYQAGSVFKLMNAQVLPRLAWVLREIPSVRQQLASGNVLYGTLDTWLIHRLTRGSKHVTDLSHASVSGLYDPFTRGWASWAVRLFGIPASVLPDLVNSACSGVGGSCFGDMDESVLGRRIPILSSMADQSASMFGLDCLKPGDIKLTLGTGSFMDINTGTQPHPSLAGLYPLIGWHIPDLVNDVDIGVHPLTFLVEGSSYDAGTVVEWGKTIDLYRNLDEMSDLACSVDDSGGVVFCPGFRGLQAPVNDPSATAGFLGVSSRTKREHLVRALLESVAFRVKQIHETVLSETDLKFTSIKVDGGTSRNDFLCQLIADLTRLSVLRSAETETSIVGVAKAMSRGRSQGTESEPKLSGSRTKFDELRRSEIIGNEIRNDTETEKVVKFGEPFDAVETRYKDETQDASQKGVSETLNETGDAKGTNLSETGQDRKEAGDVSETPNKTGDANRTELCDTGRGRKETGDYSRVFEPSWEGHERCLPAYRKWSTELHRFQSWS